MKKVRKVNTARKVETAVRAASRRAVNKIGQKGLTLTIKELSRATGVRVGNIRKYVKLDRADYSDPKARIIVRPHTYNVASVAGARQVKQGGIVAQSIFTQGGRRRVLTERGRGGVIAAPWGKRRLFSGAFLIQSGKTAMIRVGKGRLPIRPVWGPRITREFMREGVDTQLEALTAREFTPTFRHEVDFALGKIAG